MQNADVVVVGGSAAGITAAITAKRHYPDKKVVLIRKEEKVLIPCGIPYIFGTVGSPDKNLIPVAGLSNAGIELWIDQAERIDTFKSVLHTQNAAIVYEKLILATGSLPVLPPIPGADLDGVYPIYKDVAHLLEIQKRLENVQDVVIVGGGFIGVEFADEIKKTGFQNITIVEMMPHCLNLSYDDVFCIEAEKHLESRGIGLRTSSKVSAIQGSGKVESVLLASGEALKADVVILALGASPNVELAKTAGLRLGLTGAIDVDRTMRTSNEHIFACGDACEKFSFFGGRPSTLRLASIATLEARIAGANLFGISRENPGTVGVWGTAIGDMALGTAGLTKAAAKKMGYDVVATQVEGPNRHPGGMPGMSMTKVKLVFERHSGVLLGGQVRGGSDAGELINVLAACVQKRMSAEDLAMFQLGTHPALTASPVAYAISNAAEMAIMEMRK